MFDKIIFILPAVTLLLFVFNIWYKGNTVESCLLFILSLLPLMDLKISTEAWGGFKIFDAICFYAVVFLLKDFTTINLKGRNGGYFFLFVCLSIIILLGGLSSEFPDRTFLKLIKTVPVFIFARFFMTECVKEPTFHGQAIRALKCSYIIALSFLLIQRIVGLEFTFYPALAPNTLDPVFHMVRYPGIFYDSQAHGQYLAIGSFLFLYTEEGANKQSYLANYVIFVLAIAAITIAGSRAAFGGFVIGLLLVFFMAARKYRIYGIVIIFIGVLIYIVFAPSSGVFDRAENLSDDYLFRKSIWVKAFEISKEHPFLGIGSGNYQNYVMRHAQDQYLEMQDGIFVYFDQPENGYLKIMVELGFIGFSIFVLFMIVPLIRGVAIYIKASSDKKVAFFMAALIGWLIAFNTVYSIYDYRILIMVVSMIVLINTYPQKDVSSVEDESVSRFNNKLNRLS